MTRYCFCGHHRMTRRCTHPGCITILSKSNPNPYCYTHTPPPSLSKPTNRELSIMTTEERRAYQTGKWLR